MSYADVCSMDEEDILEANAALDYYGKLLEEQAEKQNKQQNSTFY